MNTRRTSVQASGSVGGVRSGRFDPWADEVRFRTVGEVDRTDPTPASELRTRADDIVAELGRITAAWNAGLAPTRAELFALADDVEALRTALPRRAPAERAGQRPLAG